MEFIFKPQPSIIVRNYRTDKLIDICWRYEQADISYKMAVNEVKVQCNLNQGLAEVKLYEALSKRGNRLPMAETRKMVVVCRQERSQNKREQVETMFRDAKHLRRAK